MGGWNKGIKDSEETKRRKSKARTGHKDTIETREKKKLSKLGKNNPNYGKPSLNRGTHHSKESKLKQSNARKLWHETHKPTRGMKGKHHKPESCKLMSDKRKGVSKSKEWGKKIGDAIKGKNNGMYGKPRPDGAGITKGYYYNSPLQGYKYLRSSYELAYAKYLDQHNILWYYEPISFVMIINGKDTSYTPDFYLPETNKFIEIKGWMRLEAELKIQKFYEKYSYYLEILDFKELKEMKIL